MRVTVKIEYEKVVCVLKGGGGGGVNSKYEMVCGGRDRKVISSPTTNIFHKR